MIKIYTPEFQEEHKLPSVHDFREMTKDALEIIKQKVTGAQKSVGGRKSAAKSTEKGEQLDGDSTILGSYKDLLYATKSNNLSEITGNGFVGQRKRNAYKWSKGGSFGNVYIDPAKLRVNRLSVKDMAGNSVMDNVVDSSLIDLLTKRYNPKVRTHQKQKIFSEI